MLDWSLSVVLLVVLSPLILLVYVVLLAHFRGKAMWTQERGGKNERIFKLLKFRSMRDLKDEKGTLLPDSERTTPIGSFIRKTGLDEIPQLVNVLKGDMSLVGPRPLLKEYLPLYPTHVRAKRHLIKPGITGLAQIHGGNALEWEKRFEFDLFYVDQHSLLLDLKTLLKTIQYPFRKQKPENIGLFHGKL
jgi:undecaprenyl phosphate N,N'-diacetylbacillosamine 1-phosphate transferase